MRVAKRLRASNFCFSHDAFDVQMSLEEQMRAMARASILIAVHGAELAVAAFLDPSAVAVELMPYGYCPGDDFYHGYSNWFDLAGVRHLIWHMQAVPAPSVLIEALGPNAPKGRHNCHKQADVYINAPTAKGILSAAYKAWKGPLLGKRDFNKDKYLNEAWNVTCNSGRVIANH